MKVILVVEDLNALNPNDCDSLYIKLKQLAEIQVEYKDLQGCWADDLIQDVTTYLLFDIQIQNLPRKSPLFWWSYMFSVLSSTAKQYVYNNEEIKKVMLCLTDNQFALDNSSRDFIKIKTRKLESLFRKGTVFEYHKLIAQVDPVAGKSLQYSINHYLKNGKTEVLMKAYTILRKQFNREFKSCRTVLNEKFLRTPPSKRSY